MMTADTAQAGVSRHMDLAAERTQPRSPYEAARDDLTGQMDRLDASLEVLAGKLALVLTPFPVAAPDDECAETTEESQATAFLRLIASRALGVSQRIELLTQRVDL